MNILRALAGCTLVLVTACGSDKEPTANTEQPAADNRTCEHQLATQAQARTM